MGRTAWLGAATVALLISMAAPRPAHAQVEVPKGSFGIAAQLGQNTGAVGGDYRLAWMLGVIAGYEPAQLSGIGLGAAWSLTGGQYFIADESLPDPTIGVLEMSLGLRFRRQLGEAVPRFVVFDAGATMLRLGRALPPDNERVYLGPFAAVGLDQYLTPRMKVSFSARYGLIGSGPASLALRISISLGS
jgi:hypothetical protein